jgi:hypothetical protein
MRRQMSKLGELGVVNLLWSEDEDGVYAEGLQHYEIDNDHELAIFQGAKCTEIRECVDLPHAISLVYSAEAVCRWYIKNGKDNKNRKVNERGWPIT